MPKLDGMSLNEVVANFPDLAPAVECIRPFIHLFDDERVFTQKGQRFFQVDSCLPLPWIDKTIATWMARVHADRISIIGFKRVPNSTNTFASVWSDSFNIEEFADFLQRISDERKTADKLPKGRKPAGGRSARAGVEGHRQKSNP